MERADLNLSAGPNDLSADVLAAVGSPILYHYDPVFQERFRAAEERIARIYRSTSHEIILMQGEAVLGLEAAARAVVSPGMPCLNLVSGVFGKGFGYWLTAIGADLHEIEVGYDDAVDPAAVAAYLDAHPEIRVVSVVHSETPSGTLNPVREIGPIARAHDAVTIVDVVSSFGGIELDAEAWQLDLLVAGPQKCLGGPPGMSLMAVSEQAWAAIERNPGAPRGSFLSMLDWREQWHGDGHFPFTPSVSDLHGVLAAADGLLAEGLDASIDRHARIAAAAWDGVEAMRLQPWPVRREIAAACVTAIRLPNGLTDVGVRDHARARYGVQLSSGQGVGNVVRMGHMGATARPMLMIAGLAAIGRTLADMGAQVDVGAGLDAALASLSASAPRMDA
ncbi:MAG: alanine--glyoxylate aminotransferase family protein [Chloroflexi bacterium]|nr:alanine--glyoxylate aminotransferase family protein [Chloroflexota bacterium]